MVEKYSIEEELAVENSSLQLFQASRALTRSHRLNQRFQFVRFFDKSTCIRTSQCTIFRVSNEFNHFRLGITIKTKTRSTLRNQLKRVIREYFRNHHALLGQFDYNVVIPKHKKISAAYINQLARCLDEELSLWLRSKN